MKSIDMIRHDLQSSFPLVEATGKIPTHDGFDFCILDVADSDIQIQLLVPADNANVGVIARIERPNTPPYLYDTGDIVFCARDDVPKTVARLLELYASDEDNNPVGILRIDRIPGHSICSNINCEISMDGVTTSLSFLREIAVEDIVEVADNLSMLTVGESTMFPVLLSKDSESPTLVEFSYTHRKSAVRFDCRLSCGERLQTITGLTAETGEVPSLSIRISGADFGVQLLSQLLTSDNCDRSWGPLCTSLHDISALCLGHLTRHYNLPQHSMKAVAKRYHSMVNKP